MITKKYNLINNIGGWIVFAIALATYWLTLEPTASYWDCGEFIIQADKLEVGHPPGNPIFMLTARFFANFAPDAQYVSLMVNAMSGLLSALTILLLFWTISHLVRRLTVRDNQTGEITLQQYLAIFGSATVGALAYCWSDTFWFSAVEGEVYAFSSFCTALVFWLILKWENRADRPHSDHYLILIAYIIGVSVAVHLLNLLCIPAIVLVFCYRKWKDMNVVKSLIALLVSFAIIVLVLYGLVPGFIKVAQQFELAFVNGIGLSFNSGTLIYAILTVGVFIWAIYALARQKSAMSIAISFICAVTLSGMLFIGHSAWAGIILTIALAGYLAWAMKGKGLPVRVLSLVMWSIAVIFVGYSSYALILIRSNARTPMNQNAPDNVFDLSSYLNREQYGENPLIYGQTFDAGVMQRQTGVRIDTITMREDGSPVTLATPYYESIQEPGKPLYSKGIKGLAPESALGFLTDGDNARNATLAQSGRDYYAKRDYEPVAKYNPELNMLFPRLYSSMHRAEYGRWVNLDTLPDNLKPLTAIDADTGERVPELDVRRQPEINEVSGTVYYPQKAGYKPTFGQNLAYFINYQLNHMYLRYFMWNFAGRQNDLLNQQQELDAGNWISGIPAIDNPRLGDQKLLPPDLGKENKGHNVYYMLPLLLGILGLLWQAFAGRRGIEQFWVIFFLFFMTGIAIVLYLNQTPMQPRERDYAFAGSFYAYAIWIGMGVAALWRILLWCLGVTRKKKELPADIGPMEAAAKEKKETEEEIQLSIITDEPKSISKPSLYCSAVACLLGLLVPIQMVSQTWDDHDRSGRYAARDYAINYLESLEPNAIVFCNGDNDTFPLWYVQEVEGVRPDVRIINLSYLNSTWYTDQQLVQSYDAPPIDIQARREDYAYDKLGVVLYDRENRTPMPLQDALKALYSGQSRLNGYPYPAIPTSIVTVPVDKKAVVARGLVAPQDTAYLVNEIAIDLAGTPTSGTRGYLTMSEVMMLDIIATNAAKGWPRPIYWCMTVGNEYYLGLDKYMRSTGMTHQLVPTMQEEYAPRTDRAYNVIMRKYRWGGADGSEGKFPYFDETAGRMLTTVRSSMTDLALQFISEGDIAREKGDLKLAKEDYRKALEVVQLMDKMVGEKTYKYPLSVAVNLAEIYGELGNKERLDNPGLVKKARGEFELLMKRYAVYLAYNRAMIMQFGNPNFTLETSYIPYRYYHLVELYEQFGGKKSEVEKILKPYGFTLAELEDNYRKALGSGTQASASDSESVDVNIYTEEILKYAEIVAHLQGLSPEEYAATSLDERNIDSLFFEIVQFYKDNGGDAKNLESNDNYKRIDQARSRRLNESYIKAHPDQVAGADF